MPPTSADPSNIKLLLNPARRRALVNLVIEITTYMRSKVSQSFDIPTSQGQGATDPFLFSRDQSSSPSYSDPEAEARQQRLEARLEKSPSTRKLQELRRDTLLYLDNWANEVIGQLKKTCEGPEDPRSEQRRREWIAAHNPPPPPYTSSSSIASGTEVKNPELIAAVEIKELEAAQSVSLLQSQYHPIPTRLTTIPHSDRVCVISSMVLLLLSLGHYSAHSRVLLLHLASALALPLEVLENEETEIARTLLLASKALTADAETQKRQQENASSRRWKVGLASLAGAAIIGVTGGLAAPVVAGAIGGIMGGVGLGGVASFLGIFAMNGALVGSLFGAFGGKMTGSMVDAYAKEVSDFKFIPVAKEWGEFGTNEQEAEIAGRRLRVTIGINGWLNGKDDIVKPWRILGRDSEAFALRYEMDSLIALGTSLEDMVSSYAWSFVKLEILKRTVLATLWSALWPVYLLKMATSIDNPFSVARNRSEKAGEVLADALINKAQGERPVTLIGYSLGSRVIYSCLKSLAERRAFGLIESVVFIGSPIPSNASNWRIMRSVVSGKIINVYSENDYILAFLYRATSIQFGVAGLQPISDVEGVQNLDLSKDVSGHLRYPELIGKILKKGGFEGVLVKDGDIEGDIQEIQLVDSDKNKGGGALDDLLGLDMDSLSISDSKPPHQNQNIGHLTQDFAGLSMDTTSPIPTSSIGMSQDLLNLDNNAHAPPTRQLSSTQQQKLPSPLTSANPLDPNIIFQHPDANSDSEDEGGIQMIDNDSDGELEMLESEPIPDEWPPFDEGKTQMGMVEEQKFLGSIPRDRPPFSSHGSGSGSRSGSGQGNGPNWDKGSSQKGPY